MRLYFLTNAFFIVFAVCIAGCGARKISKPVITQTPKQYTYHLVVEGVECKLCAQTALAIVRKVLGVPHARYHTTDETYQDSYIRFSCQEPLSQEQEEQLKAALLKEEFIGIFHIPNQ